MDLPTIENYDELARALDDYSLPMQIDRDFLEELMEEMANDEVIGLISRVAGKRAVKILGPQPAAGLKQLFMIVMAHRKEIIDWQREMGLEPRLFSASVRLRKGDCGTTFRRVRHSNENEQAMNHSPFAQDELPEEVKQRWRDYVQFLQSGTPEAQAEMRKMNRDPVARFLDELILEMLKSIQNPTGSRRW